ncbi:MAG TPA: rod shape-determining protein MreC [Chloroflexi bacterium]|nr:rod shape-determining protein MreC [Chloroflexota bacterium]
MKQQSPQIWQTATLGLVVVGIILLALGGYLAPALRTAMDPVVGVQGWLSSRFMAVYEFLTVPRDVASLRQRNSELEAEVASLQTQIIQLEQQLREAEVLYSLLQFRQQNLQNQYVAARVLGRDTSPYVQYIFVDQGSDDGIRHGMPVVTQEGLVGRVDAVTAKAARVQLITDPNMVVNVRLESLNTEAQLTGSLTGDIILDMVSQDVPLKTGELVLTSGLGGGYPPNILVGQVVSVRKFETDLFQTATVQSRVDFANLQAVLIITNFRPVDVTPLIPGN